MGMTNKSEYRINRETAVQRIKRILTVKNENLDKYDKEALKMALTSLETDEAYQLEYENPQKIDALKADGSKSE